MVNDDAQLFTMEGFAGAIIMVVTAYLVLGTTSVYTPGDTHITDMQLEQLGSDALKMMDTTNMYGNESALVTCVKANLSVEFASNFTDYIRVRTMDVNDTALQFDARIYYRNATGNISSYPLAHSNRSYSGREPSVRVARWVGVPSKPIARPLQPVVPVDMPARPQVVLVEVMIWRG